MSKYFRPWNIDQTLLLPPNVLDFVPKGHVSRFIVELVRESSQGDHGQLCERAGAASVWPADDGGAFAARLCEWAVFVAVDRQSLPRLWHSIRRIFARS